VKKVAYSGENAGENAYSTTKNQRFTKASGAGLWPAKLLFPQPARQSEKSLKIVLLFIRNLRAKAAASDAYYPAYYLKTYKDRAVLSARGDSSDDRGRAGNQRGKPKLFNEI